MCKTFSISNFRPKGFNSKDVIITQLISENKLHASKHQATIFKFSPYSESPMMATVMMNLMTATISHRKDNENSEQETYSS